LWYTGVAIVVAGVGYLGYRYLRGRNEAAPAPTAVEQSANTQSGQLVRRASRAVQKGLS
jgi:hypothetical protein